MAAGHWAALVVLALAGCLPAKTVSSTLKRGPIWAPPGTNRVFVVEYRERVRKRQGAHWDNPSKGGASWKTTQSLEVDRVRFTVYDAKTGAAFYLAELDEVIVPGMWDEAKQMLWGASARTLVRGASPTSAVVPRFVTVFGAPWPFVRDSDDGWIRDVSTGAQVSVGEAARYPMAGFDGSQLRLTRVDRNERDVVRVEQVRVLTAQMQLGPSLEYRTPPLPEGAVREAAGISVEGRFFGEVVTMPDGAAFVAHDLDYGHIAGTAAVPSLGANAVMYTFAGERFVFGAHRDGCLRGVTIVLTTLRVTPISDAVCVTKVGGEHGYRWLDAASESLFVAADGTLQSLGAKVEDPVVLGRTRIAFTVPAVRGVDVVSLDVVTGARSTLLHHAAVGQRLINVGAWGATFLDGADRIVTVSPSGAATAIKLPPSP